MAKVAKVVRDEVFRVYRIDDSTREAIKNARLANAQTVKQFLDSAITEQLPLLLAELRASGITSVSGKLRPLRAPLTDSLVQLLQAASVDSGLPQSLLLLTALRRASVGTVKIKPAATRRGGRRRKSARVSIKSPKKSPGRRDKNVATT